jgi:anti-sigma B factor antagonist
MDIASTEDAVAMTLFGEVDIECRATVEAGFRSVVDADTVVIDLRHVTFIDSSGIGVFVRAHAAAAERGGSMALCPGPDNVMRALRMAGVDDLFELVDEPTDVHRPAAGTDA